MNWKTRNRIKKYNPLKRVICEILDGDWETHDDLAKIGIAIILIAYKEHETGIKEASTIVPYLESAGINFNGKQLRHCLDIIEENQFIIDGKIQLEIEGETSAIEWALVACIFSGWLQRKKGKDGKWYYKNTEKGMKVAEQILKNKKNE